MTVGHVPTAVQGGSKTSAVFGRPCPDYLHCGEICDFMLCYGEVYVR